MLFHREDTEWSTILDCTLPAGLDQFSPYRVMIEEPHHIHHFAGHFFCGRQASVAVLVSCAIASGAGSPELRWKVTVTEKTIKTVGLLLIDLK